MSIEFLENPTGEPVHLMTLPTGQKAWLVHEYELVKQVLNNQGLSNDKTSMGERSPVADLGTKERSIIEHDLLNIDPPRHTHMRGLVSHAFTMRAATSIRPTIERIAGELVDSFEDDEEVDLFARYTSPLPTLVISEMLGIPREDQEEVREWCDIFATDVLRISDRTQAATSSMLHYAQHLLRRRSVEPGDDLVSHIATAGIDEDDQCSLVLILMFAAQSGTTQMISRGLQLLLTHDDELAKLRADASLLSGAVDEILRHATPLRITGFRVPTAAPLRLGGVEIAPGEIVMCELTDANHDPARFADPDTFDIGRPDNQHVAFGSGLHRCLGANVAKVQTEVAIETLLKRFTRIELAVPEDELPWLITPLMSQLTGLPVRLTR